MLYDGSIRDKTNFVSDNFLKMNSCGFENPIPGYTVVRKFGRKDYHILLLNRGACVAYHNGVEYQLSPGNIVIYFPDEEQRYSFSEDSKTLWCHFTGAAVKDLFDGCHLTSGVYQIEKNTSIFQTFSRMIERFSIEEKMKFSIPSLIELIYHISDAVKMVESKEISTAISRALLYIHTNYNRVITIEELAKIAGYSKSRFSHLFVIECGETPITYQRNIQLSMACELLITTENKISEIALHCGFQDPLYFSRAFKKKYHISPKEHREKYGINN